MTMLRVSDKIFSIFPDIVLGVVTFQNVSNVGERADLMAALRREEARTVTNFANVAINHHPRIAPWREAYRRFGAKPKDYPSSIENLIAEQAVDELATLVEMYCGGRVSKGIVDSRNSTMILHEKQ